MSVGFRSCFMVVGVYIDWVLWRTRITALTCIGVYGCVIVNRLNYVDGLSLACDMTLFPTVTLIDLSSDDHYHHNSRLIAITIEIQVRETFDE